ncbi:MAG: alpha/beta hydrolase [Clostridiales bacterium]|jgi:acetyl esterase|nr:alpha/beta hydrolase [Clostridiales bacterium]
MKTLTQEQIIKRGKFTLAFSRFLTSKMGYKPAKVGKERFVDSSYGKIRTLQYGFEDKGVKPCVFDLHGGGFILGDAEFDEPMNTQFYKEAGVKIVSIRYPKAPEYPFPIPLKAVYEVITTYVKNAASEGIDPKHIGIMGHSAGAALSTSICMMAKGKSDFKLNFQILDYPPLDLFTDPAAKPQPKGALSPGMSRLFNMCYVKPEEAKDPLASPVFASRDDLVGLPPALVILAGGDSLHDEGAKYIEMLKDANVPVESKDYPNVAHGFTLKPGPETTDACALMSGYIKKHI